MPVVIGLPADTNLRPGRFVRVRIPVLFSLIATPAPCRVLRATRDAST